MTGLLLTIFSGFIGYTGEDLTGKIQETYVIERYFERVEEQSPLVYRNGRVLGQKVVGITGGNFTNRTDCGGLMVGYLMSLDLIKTRRKDIEGESFTYDGGGLNSFRLYTLGKPIERAESKRGDFVYMEFPSGARHFAVVCDTGATEIFDLYKKPYAECRKRPFPRKALFATNGVVEFLEERELILSGTIEILSSLTAYNEEQKLKNIIDSYVVIDYASLLHNIVEGRNTIFKM